MPARGWDFISRRAGCSPATDRSCEAARACKARGYVAWMRSSEKRKETATAGLPTSGCFFLLRRAGCPPATDRSCEAARAYEVRGVLSPSGTRLAPTGAARRPVACCGVVRSRARFGGPFFRAEKNAGQIRKTCISCRDEVFRRTLWNIMIPWK